MSVQKAMPDADHHLDEMPVVDATGPRTNPPIPCLVRTGDGMHFNHDPERPDRTRDWLGSYFFD